MHLHDERHQDPVDHEVGKEPRRRTQGLRPGSRLEAAAPPTDQCVPLPPGEGQNMRFVPRAAPPMTDL